MNGSNEPALGIGRAAGTARGMSNIERWLADHAISFQSLAELLSGLSERLVAAGVPLLRCNISMSVVNPLFRARFLTWQHDAPIVEGTIPHGLDPVTLGQSPIGYMYLAGEKSLHWRLTSSRTQEFGILDDMAAKGATDFVATFHRFDHPVVGGLRGVGLTFALRQPDGLSDSERHRLEHVAWLVAPIAYRITLGDIVVSLMDAYVGAPASRRILDGAVERGVGEPIDAVLLMADLRGFTTLADTAGRDLIERLDEHLDAMAAPVLAQGGHVLKFLGDGLLAAFPINDGLPRADACRQALAAAREALVLNDRVNRARPDEPELGLDVAIHAGEVFYGNVGAAARLDFTVIGPAVNELSRMEALCSHLGRSIVISAEVAAEIPETVIPLGRFQLRGVEAERELFAVRSLSTAKTA